MESYDKEKRGWFHEKPKENKKYEIITARIDNPYFGMGDRDDGFLGLHMILHSDLGDSVFHIYDSKNIQELLMQFHLIDVKRLEGKVVEIFCPGPYSVAGFRVAEHLLQVTNLGY